MEFLVREKKMFSFGPNVAKFFLISPSSRKTLKFNFKAMNSSFEAELLKDYHSKPREMYTEIEKMDPLILTFECGPCTNSRSRAHGFKMQSLMYPNGKDILFLMYVSSTY